MLFDLGEIEMNRQFGSIDGLYSTSHCILPHTRIQPFTEISAPFRWFLTAKTPTNTNQQQGFCSRNTAVNNAVNRDTLTGTGPIVFGTAVATMCFVFARTGFRRKVAAAIVNFDR